VVHVTAFEISLVLSSALLHALWSASIKGSRSPLGFNLLQLAPPLVAACLLPIWISPAAIPLEVWGIVAGTGIFHGLYFYWFARALETGALSVVYPIARSAPAFLPLVAIPLLGETLSLRGGVGIAVVMAGMWAVQTDGFQTRGLARGGSRGVGFAMLTLAASVGYSICDKAAMARLAVAPWDASIPPAAVYYVLLCASGAIVFVPLALRRVSFGDLRALARTEMRTACFAAVIGFVGYGLILQALRTAPVSYVVATRQSSVLFAIAIAALRWRERPTRLHVLGAVATVIGVALVAE
jgi:drug/metabolite transporter (DMT)-like permease